MFNDALHFLVETQETPDGERLGQNFPFEWIEQAVAYTGRASIRQRQLPTEQVLWLVVALALYRHQSIIEVVDDLDLALPDAQVPFITLNRGCFCFDHSDILRMLTAPFPANQIENMFVGPNK